MSTLILPLADQTTHDLTAAVLALRTAMVDMTHTQTQLMDKLDRFVSQVIVHETRLKRLEDQMMAHGESATWIKASTRFLPLIIAALVLGHDIH